MSVQLWLAFVAASAVMLVIPGPTILTVISYSVAHGRRANVPLVAAVALGDSTALVLSLLGVGSLLAASAAWFTVVKWAGGLYLLYLGAKLLRAGVTSGEGLPEAAPATPARLFLNTYAVTALNPKGMVFFVAFLPQFIAPEAPVAPQLWLLAITFVTIGLFASSLTENQIIAAVTGLVMLLLLFVIAWPADSAGKTVGDVLRYVSVTEHFAGLVKGVIDSKSLVYFVTMIAGWLFLTQRSVESIRWR